MRKLQAILSSNCGNKRLKRLQTGRVDDYTTVCFLDYPYFKEHHKPISTYLSKKQKLDADAKAIQKTNFTENLRYYDIISF